jgi:hypothetical protein
VTGTRSMYLASFVPQVNAIHFPSGENAGVLARQPGVSIARNWPFSGVKMRRPSTAYRSCLPSDDQLSDMFPS